MTIFTTSLILFLIMNPLGQLKAFANSLQGIDHKRQSEIITRELLIALGVMLFFNAVGEYLFDLLKISDVTVYLSLGIILFLGAINILFPPADAPGHKKLEGEPFLVPIAIPIIAGPALLATIMLYAQTETSAYTSIIACAISWFAASLIFLNHKRFFSFFGTSGVLACEKLMGMILVLISVQRLLEGALMFYQSVATP
jgi:multiple antibiotic resistance protein